MLLLSNQDVDDLLTMDDCIAAFESTYRAAATGGVVNGRRSDMVTATRATDRLYALKMVGAVTPALGVGAVRVNSDVLSFPVTDGRARRVKVPAAPGGRWVGLVMLFDCETGEPLALLPDGVLQRIRVGATSGLAIRHLARPDARCLALLGSGWQAATQAIAAAAVRRLDEIRVFSPDPAHRAAFAETIARKLAIPVRPVATVEAAVADADLVLCATNSLRPVLPADLIAPGMHVGSIRDGEIGAEALARADTLIVHDRGNVGSDHLVTAAGVGHPEAHAAGPRDATATRVAASPSLAELVAGRAVGRTSPEAVTCFLNHHGLGHQFAAAGAVLLAAARAAGRGRDLPTEWFTQDVHS